MSASLDRKALLALLFGAAVIGAGTVLVRLAGTGAAAAGWWRLAFASPLLVVLAANERRGEPARRSPGLGAPAWLLALCGLSFAFDLVFWHYSIRLTTIANSSVLANLTPVIVTTLAWAVFGEKPARLLLAGLACAVLGAGIMAFARSGPGDHAPAPLAGDALALAASCSYAVYFMMVKGARRTASALQIMLASSLAGAPLVLIAALAFHERIVPPTALGWTACGLLGLMHVSGQGAIAWSLGRVPTAVAAVVMLAQPVLAAVAGWLTFGEAISPLQALGAAVALAGVAVAQIAARGPIPPMEGEAEASAGR